MQVCWDSQILCTYIFAGNTPSVPLEKDKDPFLLRFISGSKWMEGPPGSVFLVYTTTCGVGHSAEMRECTLRSDSIRHVASWLHDARTTRR